MNLTRPRNQQQRTALALGRYRFASPWLSALAHGVLYGAEDRHAAFLNYPSSVVAQIGGALPRLTQLVAAEEGRRGAARRPILVCRVAKAGRKGKADSNQTRGNPWGHFRNRQSIEEFARCIERRGDVPVLREFSNNTASWVIANFAPLESEIHQAMTVGRAARRENEAKYTPQANYQFSCGDLPRCDWIAVALTGCEHERRRELDGRAN